MKKSLRWRYTFHTTDGEYIGHGDCPVWADGVIRGWGRENVVLTRERVLYVTGSPVGTIR